MNFLLGLPIFRGYVKFPGCIDCGYTYYMNPRVGNGMQQKKYSLNINHLKELTLFSSVGSHCFFIHLHLEKKHIAFNHQTFGWYLKWRNPRKPIYKLYGVSALWIPGKPTPKKWSAIRFPPFFGTWNSSWQPLGPLLKVKLLVGYI